MNITGTAKTVISVEDQSVLRGTGLKGITGMIGETERGPVATPILIGSWVQFTRIFGGLISTSNFPLYCKRALEAGAKLRVCRAVNYSNIATNTPTGVTASKTLAGVITLTANSLGAWGNNLSLEIKDNSALVANTKKLVITLTGYPDLTEEYVLPNTPAAGDLIDIYNRTNLLGPITLLGGALAVTAVTPFTGGTNTGTLIAADYVGDSTQNNGIEAFNTVMDIVRIACPDFSNPTVDTALVSYADRRKDLMAVIRTPIGLSGTGVVAYRNGTTPYSHQPFNSWRAILTTGGLKVINPLNSAQIQISEIADVLGCMARRDNDYAEWYPFAGSKRGLVGNALGVVMNFGNAALQTDADNLDVNGINPVIEHPSFGICAWGNSSLLRANTLLKHANVAELMLYLTRELKPLIESELFEPNDIQTWKTIYRKVTPLLDAVQAGRGIWRYRYEGDQDIDDITQAQVNNPNDVDAGKYIFRLFIAPKVGMKYLGVKVILTNSGVDFESIV